MAIQEFEPQAEPEPARITLLKELIDGREAAYHFFVNGEESSVTLTREITDKEISDFTYCFKFYGWEFGAADVHNSKEVNSIDWQGITDGLEGLAKDQAQRLMEQSKDFLPIAIRSDFETQGIEDWFGDPL
jgi:hypothetical protein